MVYILKLSDHYLVLKFKLKLSSKNTASFTLAPHSAAHLVAQSVQSDMWSFSMVLLTLILCRMKFRAARLMVSQNCV